MNNPKWINNNRLAYLDSIANSPEGQQVNYELIERKQPVYFKFNPDRLLYGTMTWETVSYYKVNLIDTPLLHEETILEYKQRTLIKAWSLMEAENTRIRNEYEDRMRHTPLLKASKQFGGIAREIYLENLPTFKILNLELNVKLKPCAKVLINRNKSILYVDISSLFVGLSANKRKQILKYNKRTNEFNKSVYDLCNKVVNAKIYSYRREDIG
jgi:hypothetical protein